MQPPKSVNLVEESLTNKNTVSEFGEWIKKQRLERDWSLRELEKRIDGVCTFSYIDQLERDVRGKKNKPLRPAEEIVNAMARVFNAPIDEVRRLAGYAPIQTFEKPATLEQFLGILEAIGVEVQNFHAPPFDASPEFYHALLDDLARFIEFKLYTPPSRTFSLGDVDERPERRRESPPLAHFPERRHKAG